MAASALGVALAWPTPGWSGVYDLAEAPVGPAAAGAPAAMPLAGFQDLLGVLLRAQVAQPETAERARYLRRARAIEADDRKDAASAQELSNLGACYLRLGQPTEAMDVLTRAAARDRRNFTTLANLGTAYQLLGQPIASLGRLREAREVWPVAWPGLTAAQLAWYRKVEGYQERLVRLRVREPAGTAPPDAPDDLFGLRLVGPRGTYQAGELAESERGKLPPDAIAVVQQLLVWLPGDTRLYWLLAEVLNAQGKTADAAAILDECAWVRRYDSRTLREHRRVLREALARARPPAPPADVDAASAPSEPPPGWRLNRGWALAVGVGGALVLGLLVYLQMREVRQRRARPRAQGRG